MRLFIVTVLMALVTVAHAVEPDEMLDDPALEERAQEIDEQLRCVVCQSQSIAESNAPLAKDLRVLVRERLSDGDTNAQAIDYIVERYGDYVLLKPPVQPNTYFLWVFPALVLLIGGVIAVLALRRAGAAHAATPLSPDEEAALERLRQEQE